MLEDSQRTKTPDTSGGDPTPGHVDLSTGKMETKGGRGDTQGLVQHVSVSFCLCLLSFPFPLPPFLSLSLSVCLSLSLTPSLPQTHFCLFDSAYLCHPESLSLSLSVFSLVLCVFFVVLSLSLFLSVSVCLSVCLSLSLSPSLYPSKPPTLCLFTLSVFVSDSEGSSYYEMCFCIIISPAFRVQVRGHSRDFGELCVTYQNIIHTWSKSSSFCAHTNKQNNNNKKQKTPTAPTKKQQGNNNKQSKDKTKEETKQ